MFSIIDIQERTQSQQIMHSYNARRIIEEDYISNADEAMNIVEDVELVIIVVGDSFRYLGEFL